MIAEGLLWFDDDPRRPFNAKMVEAARRFSERTGWQATACEAHPDTLALQAGTAHTGRGKAAKAAPPLEVDTSHLSITPNLSLRPNYILVGVEAGKTPRRARPPKPISAPAAKRVKAAKSAAPEPAPLEQPATPRAATPRAATPRAATPRASHHPSSTSQPTALNA